MLEVALTETYCVLQNILTIRRYNTHNYTVSTPVDNSLSLLPLPPAPLFLHFLFLIHLACIPTSVYLSVYIH